MKTLLIVWLFTGESFAIPYNDHATCDAALHGLDLTQVRISVCTADVTA